ncbi:MAG: 5-formyltetrahydrofolate cyclo-ligase [Verrucomicrobia bacterium]|nr:5-formyltetrahydrofolate cyclo-ligase [Verrucomicrobiota bacterium]MDA1087479.1 5-formyltetrahydrofolate cyclo-ligase [Verrucomicrobiota bacterium]
MSETKASIRARMSQRRSVLAPDWITRESDRVQSAVIEWAEFESARSVACYIALPDEVQTSRIIEAAHATGKRVRVPAFDRESKAYRFCGIEVDTPIARGPFQVPEPVSPEWIDGEFIDLAIVPGVAFDTTGARLGHGKGYIDRLLKRYADSIGATTGLGFDFQIVEDVPMHESDVRLDFIVSTPPADGTEVGGVIRCVHDREISYEGGNQ